LKLLYLPEHSTASVLQFEHSSGGNGKASPHRRIWVGQPFLGSYLQLTGPTMNVLLSADGSLNLI